MCYCILQKPLYSPPDIFSLIYQCHMFSGGGLCNSDSNCLRWPQKYTITVIFPTSLYVWSSLNTVRVTADFNLREFKGA